VGETLTPYRKNTKALLDARKEVGVNVNPVSKCQKAGQKQSVKIGNRFFEFVAKFKYLGITIKNQNCIHEAITSRLNSRNACYHSFQSFVIPPAVQQ
jgi:hypothetical protein